MTLHQPAAPSRPAVWMRARQLVSVLAISALSLVSMLGPGVSSVAAASPGVPPMLAGRPISGTTADSCQGTFYGRVAGVTGVVLFTAGHCAGGEGEEVLYTDQATSQTYALGVRSGVDTEFVASDLSYIILYDGSNGHANMVPSVLNQVWNGSGFWTITHQPTLRCNNADSYVGQTTYQAFQFLATDEAAFSTGYLSEVDGSGATCGLKTTNNWHGFSSKDSGSSMVLAGDTNTVSGVANSRWNFIPTYEEDPDTTHFGVRFRPVADGLDYLGGVECINAACTFPVSPGTPKVLESSLALYGTGSTLWYNPTTAGGTTFQVSLQASDGAVAPFAQSGIGSVLFPALSGVGGAGQFFIAPPFRTNPGLYTFDAGTPTITGAQAIDIAETFGTDSSAATFFLNPDSTAPTAPTPTLSSGDPGVGQVANEVYVTASGSTDSGSGLAGYTWTMSGAQTGSGTQQPDGSGEPIVTTVGTTTVAFTAIDNVGNASDSVSVDVVITANLNGGPSSPAIDLFNRTVGSPSTPAHGFPTPWASRGDWGTSDQGTAWVPYQNRFTPFYAWVDPTIGGVTRINEDGSSQMELPLTPTLPLDMTFSGIGETCQTVGCAGARIDYIFTGFGNGLEVRITPTGVVTVSAGNGTSSVDLASSLVDGNKINFRIVSSDGKTNAEVYAWLDGQVMPDLPNASFSGASGVRALTKIGVQTFPVGFATQTVDVSLRSISLTAQDSSGGDNPTDTDTFVRPDQNTWGQSSSGATWLESTSVGIVGHAGGLTAGGDYNGESQLLPIATNTLPMEYTTSIHVESSDPGGATGDLNLPGVSITGGNHLYVGGQTVNLPAFINDGSPWNIKVRLEDTTTTVWVWSGNFGGPPNAPAGVFTVDNAGSNPLRIFHGSYGPYFQVSYFSSTSDKLLMSELNVAHFTPTDPDPTPTPELPGAGVGTVSLTVLPPSSACDDTTCDPFTGPSAIISDPIGGWTIDEASSPATSSVFAASTHAVVHFSGSWYLDGHFADLQLCYAGGPSGDGTLCDTMPEANAHLGSHVNGAPVVNSGAQAFDISGVVPDGYSGAYLLWNVGSSSSIVTLFYTVNGMGESDETALEVAASITLTGIPATIDFGSGVPGDTAVAPQFTANVLTNNSAGYTLTCTTSDMVSGAPVETIAASAISYTVSAVGLGTADGGNVVDDATPLTLSHSDARSDSAGDDFTVGASLVIPFVRGTTYDGAATFTASTL